MAVASPAPSTLNPMVSQSPLNSGPQPAGTPDWQSYSAASQNYTPHQSFVPPQTFNPPGMQNVSAGAGTLASQLGAPDTSGMQALYSLLMGQNAPQTQADNTALGLLGEQGNLESQILGLNAGGLKAESNIQMNRANKMTANAQAQERRAMEEPAFINQIYQQANTQAGLQYGAARNALLSDATARGAVNAHGTVGQFQNQYGQFANQLAQNLTTKNRSLADQQLALEQARNLEQQYGLDKQDIIQRMNNGLSVMGLQGQLDHVDLLKAMNGLDADKAGMAKSVIDQAMQLGLANPAFMQYFMNQQGPQVAPGQGPSPTFNAGNRRVQ